MAEAARRRGHAYQVLTDHSQSLAIARGLAPDRVEQQRTIIAELNARYAAEEAAGTAPPETPPEGFRLLHGCELEIRADGALDYPDDLLERFDLVVASVHVSRRQSRDDLTQRTLNGIRSPHVDVIAHPSGRMIGTRDDLDLDWDAVYAEAARTGTVLEMNGSPHRLDLAVERARRAVEVGCTLSIDSDAHKTAEFDHLRWGISQARRAWVEPRPRAEHALAGRPARLGRGQAGARVSWTRAVAGTPRGRGRATRPGARGGHGRRAVAADRAAGGLVRRDLPARRDPAGHAPGPRRRGAPGPRAPAIGVPIESLILPAVAAVACVGAIRLVPFGLGLAPALLITGLLVERCLALEARIVASPAELDAEDRTAVLVTTLVVAFLGFVGVAAMIPGGLAQPGAAGAAGGPLPETDLLVLAAGDAAIAFLLGYRAAALRVSSVADALWSAATYAAAIAIGAAAVRFLEIPRLLGPALLTLTFYLWDAFHGAAPARRRDPRWLWQTVLLVALGLAVIALNLMVRGSRPSERPGKERDQPPLVFRGVGEHRLDVLGAVDVPALDISAVCPDGGLQPMPVLDAQARVGRAVGDEQGPAVEPPDGVERAVRGEVVAGDEAGRRARRRRPGRSDSRCATARRRWRSAGRRSWNPPRRPPPPAPGPWPAARWPRPARRRPGRSRTPATPCSRWTQSQAPRTSRYSSVPPAKRPSSRVESP